MTSTATTPNSAALVEELRRVVEPLSAEKVVPGVAIGLVAPGIETTACFGVTNVEYPEPVDGDTLFQIASITKTFTAVALMRLAEEGKVHLDATVRTYLPEFRLRDESAAATITLRHILTHAGGFFGDIFKDTGPGDDALAKYIESLADLPQYFPPGKTWSASNADFCLAGRIIEVVTGETYERATARLVLEPLGMERSFFFMADAATYRLAAGHFVIDGRAVVTRPTPNVAMRPIAIIPRSTVATGGLLSTARDMIRYTRSLLGDGAILSKASLDLMASALVPGAWDQWRGIPWMLRDIAGVRVLVHGGGGARSGQRSLLTVAPARGTGVITLTNSPAGAFVHDAVAEWWVRRFISADAKEVPTDIGAISPTGASAQSRPASAAELAPYAGKYASPDTDVNVDVESKTGYLLLREVTRRRLISSYKAEPPKIPPARMAMCGKDRFVVLDGPTAGAPIEFLKDDAGRITFIWMDHGRMHPRTS